VGVQGLGWSYQCSHDYRLTVQSHRDLVGVGGDSDTRCQHDSDAFAGGATLQAGGLPGVVYPDSDHPQRSAVESGAAAHAGRVIGRVWIVTDEQGLRAR
jgi:hypothetical protein